MAACAAPSKEFIHPISVWWKNSANLNLLLTLASTTTPPSLSTSSQFPSKLESLICPGNPSTQKIIWVFRLILPCFTGSSTHSKQLILFLMFWPVSHSWPSSLWELFADNMYFSVDQRFCRISFTKGRKLMKKLRNLSGNSLLNGESTLSSFSLKISPSPTI